LQRQVKQKNKINQTYIGKNNPEFHKQQIPLKKFKKKKHQIENKTNISLFGNNFYFSYSFLAFAANKNIIF